MWHGTQNLLKAAHKANLLNPSKKLKMIFLNCDKMFSSLTVPLSKLVHLDSWYPGLGPFSLLFFRIFCFMLTETSKCNTFARLIWIIQPYLTLAVAGSHHHLILFVLGQQRDMESPLRIFANVERPQSKKSPERSATKEFRCDKSPFGLPVLSALRWW